MDEVERLRAAETNPAVRYVAARAGLPGKQSSTVSNYALHRSQAYLATKILADRHRTDFQELWREAVSSKTAPTEANYSNVADPMADPFFAYYARHFAQQSLPRMTDRSAILDDLWDGPADMLKIDTDGWDFDVLQGAERVLGSCLAVEIETQFHGPVSPTANVFCNIDAFLRERGFSLFRLAPVHYARSALPKPFLYDLPANNQAGQITWADALYIRDLGGKDAEHDRLRTLALILDLYELEDAAAEILLSTPGLIEGDWIFSLERFTASAIGKSQTPSPPIQSHFIANWQITGVAPALATPRAAWPPKLRNGHAGFLGGHQEEIDGQPSHSAARRRTGSRGHFATRGARRCREPGASLIRC